MQIQTVVPRGRKRYLTVNGWPLLAPFFSNTASLEPSSKVFPNHTDKLYPAHAGNGRAFTLLTRKNRWTYP